MISHGSAAFLKERLMDVSDASELAVCNECGMPAVSNAQTEVCYCKTCNYSTDVSQVRLPYACKLLIQELNAMCIRADIH